MKQPNKNQNIIFALGGALMVVGAFAFAVLFFVPVVKQIAPWVFLVGTAMFACMQNLQPVDQSNLVLRRLKSLQQLAGIMFVLSGILMVDTTYHIFQSLFANYEDYLTYVHNKWVLLLLVGALLQLYTTLRLSKEQKRNAK